MQTYHWKLIISTTIFFVWQACCYGQNFHLSARNSGYCNESKATFLGVKMLYPIKISEAMKQYNLKYRSNYIFHGTIPNLPKLSPDVPYNFSIIFPTDTPSLDDNLPGESFLNKPVKGYTFWLRGTTNSDSLITQLEKQFGGKFIKRENKSTRALNMNRGLFFYEMKLSDCVHIAMSDYGPNKMLVMLCFYFDIPDNEREWFPH